MARFLLGFVAAVVVCVATVSAVCTVDTFSKIRQCIYQSKLYDTALTPKNTTEIDTFCMEDVNKTAHCLHEIKEECMDDAKQMKLLKMTVDIKKLQTGISTFCGKKAELGGKQQCMTDVFDSKVYQDCVNAAAGKRINAGDPQKLRTGLDVDCTFFDEYVKCFLDNFKTECQSVGLTFGGLLESGRYSFCSKTEVEKQKAIDDYNAPVGGASSIVYSLSTLLLAASVWLCHQF